MIIREIGASLRALFTRLSAKTTTIAGTESVYLDDAGTSVKAALSDAIRYGGGPSTRIVTVGNANVHQSSAGATWLEVTGQTAGNARGAGAFDWQAVRGNAARVASGANAMAIGAECTASGTYSTAIGYVARAEGSNSFACGSYVSAVGSGSIALGTNVRSSNSGQFVFGYGVSPSADSQALGSLQTFYTATADASSTPLNITGTATARMVIPTTRSVAFIGIVQAICNVSSSSNFIKAWEIRGVITRDGNNTTRIVGTPTITVLAQDADGTPTPSTWAIASITADDTNESLAINVTGQTGTTIRWQASLFYSQVGF
jgi:hypothetical protein